MRILLLGLAFGLVTFGGQISAWASMPCYDRQAILDRMLERYGEVPVAGGPTNSGALLEVLKSPDTGDKPSTWTVILHMPNGRSCLVAAGEGWREVPPPPGGKRIRR